MRYICGIIIVIMVIVIMEYNKFTKLRNKVRQSRSSVDVYLNKRFDLIPNLVECVKAYSRYEESLFEKVVALRKEYNNNKDLNNGIQAYSELEKVMITLENYPDLKANEQFLELQRNLGRIEDELQAARRLYNGDVTLYNTTIESFPNVIFAKIFLFKKEKTFEIADERRENIRINL